MKRFRIELDIEAPDTASEAIIRAWLSMEKTRREWPKVITSAVVQTSPEMTL